MRILFIVLGFVAILMTAVPILKHQAWWVRVFDFPRLQLVFVGLVGLAGHTAIGWQEPVFDAVFAALLVAALGYQAFMIFPYTPLARVQTEWSLNPDPANSI